jgi:hypothetical protein
MSADFHVCATGNTDGISAFCGVAFPISVCDFLLASEAGLIMIIPIGIVMSDHLMLHLSVKV